MEPSQLLDHEEQAKIRTVPQWSIWRIMVVIAMTAPLLALMRYPFAFGMAVYAGSIALFIGLERFTIAWHTTWR